MSVQEVDFTLADKKQHIEPNDIEIDPSQINKFPKSVKYILIMTLFESYGAFGLRMMLNQYLKSGFGLPVPQAKSHVHLFNGTTYLATMLGAAVSDSYLGTYRTMLWFYVVYIIGSILISILATSGIVASFGTFPIWSYLLPGVMIALGAGGIKPCVPSLAGYQFADTQKSLMDKFFAYNFLASTLGSILSLYTLPYSKNLVDCFGSDCYMLAYALSTALVLISAIALILGAKHYRVAPSQGEFLPFKAVKACFSAGKLWIKATPDLRQAKKSFLEFAEPIYGYDFIIEIRKFCHVAAMFIPLIFVWMLDEQSGTEWQNQYEYMDKTVLGIFIPTESCANINLLLIVIFIPLLSNLLFPYLERTGRGISAACRIALGYLVILIAFVIAALLDVAVHNQASQAVIESGVVTDCPGCLNGIWQLPQFALLSLGQSILFPSCTLFAYQHVGPLMRSSSAALFFLSMAFGNLSVPTLEFPLHALFPETYRLWAYLTIGILGFIWFLALWRFWFIPLTVQTSQLSLQSKLVEVKSDIKEGSHEKSINLD